MTAAGIIAASRSVLTRDAITRRCGARPDEKCPAQRPGILGFLGFFRFPELSGFSVPRLAQSSR
jgi:hypothetical protein